MDRSLDEIIRATGPRRPQGVRKKKQMPVRDARNFIISKKRIHITDARDKLADLAKNKDARLKLETLRMKRRGIVDANVFRSGPALKNVRNNFYPGFKGRMARGLFSDITRQVHTSPLVASPHISRNVQRSAAISMSGFPLDISMDEEYIPTPLKPIIRSVNNDISSHYIPPPPTLSNSSKYKSQNFLREKLNLSDRRANLNFKIIASNNPDQGILKRSNEPIYIDDDSPNPISILKKRPFGGKSSTGTYSKYENVPSSLSSSKYSGHHRLSPPPPTHSNGYRIVVSNLQNSVTAGDINELFGDIGKLVESRLVRLGTAEVIYSSLKDAQKAVDVYHNRQLDGQPMKCFLVNPRNPLPSANKTSGFGSLRSGKPTLPASSNSSVIPDISTFHKVLFRKR